MRIKRIILIFTCGNTYFSILKLQHYNACMLRHGPRLLPLKKSLITTFCLCLLLLTACNINQNDEVIEFNTRFPNDDLMIESQESHYFDYTAKITITNENTVENNLDVIYSVDITMKDKSETYKDVSLTCAIDERSIELFKLPMRQYFGTASDDLITLSSDNFGIESVLRTPLDIQNQTVNKNDMILALKYPLKVLVTFDGNTEFVRIDSEKITFEWLVD